MIAADYQQWQDFWGIHHHYAERLNWRLEFRAKQFVEGAHLMFTTEIGSAPVPVSVRAVDAGGAAAQATLSDVTYTSSDSSIVSLAPNPDSASGVLMSSIGVGTATVSSSAVATEPDGFSHIVTGSETVVVEAAPAPPADHLVLVFGAASGTQAATRVQTIKR